MSQQLFLESKKLQGNHRIDNISPENSTKCKEKKNLVDRHFPL